ncbi:MAG: chemotaxis protein methyltransferase [Phycisphaerae bacterium]|nr:MAG: chemotaxis protein methyltransferase [Phycisphaerae bacterium]
MIKSLEASDLTKEEYELFRELIYDKSGINLGTEKMQLLSSRLTKLLRKENYAAFRDYHKAVVADKSGVELSRLLDAVSTNTTHLFREISHFNFLTELIKKWTSDKKWCAVNRELRIWSAGCSSGEEPHSLAMVVHDLLNNHPSVKPRILATDISTQVLGQARRGQFVTERAKSVPPAYRSRYLKKVKSGSNEVLEASSEIRNLIKFSRFNLMTPTFPFRLGFHVIFCRNVMIYFDQRTQEGLVNRYAKSLAPGGHLMIGHSESLNGINQPLAYVEPTIYRRD